MLVAQLKVNTNRKLVKIMRKNPLNKGIIMENAAGIGTVTSEMVEARARELAAINGRPSSEPSETDYQQAKRELTGEAETDPQEETSESIPESERWDPVPGSTGRQAADSLGEDEDAEGRSESAQMFEEGVAKRSTIKCVRHPGRREERPIRAITLALLQRFVLKGLSRRFRPAL